MATEITYFGNDFNEGTKTIRLDADIPHILTANPFEFVRKYDLEHGTDYHCRIRCIYEVRSVS